MTHQSVGVVRSINRNGTDVCVDFPEQNNWTGLISEMEVVPGIHPRHMYVSTVRPGTPFAAPQLCTGAEQVVGQRHGQKNRKKSLYIPGTHAGILAWGWR